MTTHDTGIKIQKQAKIDLTVEWLGQMSDRRRAANEANDLTELEQIACEYEARGMVSTAGEVRKSIAIRKREAKS